MSLKSSLAALRENRVDRFVFGPWSALEGGWVGLEPKSISIGLNRIVGAEATTPEVVIGT